MRFTEKAKSSERRRNRAVRFFRIFRHVQAVADVVVDRTGRLGGMILFAMVALVFLNAFNRYVFTFSPVWLQELEWHLLAAQGALGLAYAWHHDDHIAVDVFSQRYSHTAKLWMNLLVALLIAIPCSILIVKVSIPYIVQAAVIWEGSPDPGGLPYRFVPKSLVALGFVFLVVQAFAITIKSAVGLLSVYAKVPPAEG